MKKLTRYPVLFLIIVFASGPLNLYSQKNKKDVEAIMNADRKFSDFSIEYGMNKAFFEFADTSVVLLKPNMKPLKGIEALKKYHEGIDDSEIILSWEPSFGRVAKSGDLGYTYGIWKLISNEGTFQGTYVTVWTRDKNGEWKFVLDSGNGGLGE